MLKVTSLQTHTLMKYHSSGHICQRELRNFYETSRAQIITTLRDFQDSMIIKSTFQKSLSWLILTKCVYFNCYVYRHYVANFKLVFVARIANCHVKNDAEKFDDF